MTRGPVARIWHLYLMLLSSCMYILRIAPSHAGLYRDVRELETDMRIMIDNACRFNNPGSQIYLDALQLLEGIRATFNPKKRKQRRQQQQQQPPETGRTVPDLVGMHSDARSGTSLTLVP